MSVQLCYTSDKGRKMKYTEFLLIWCTQVIVYAIFRYQRTITIINFGKIKGDLACGPSTLKHDYVKGPHSNVSAGIPKLPGTSAVPMGFLPDSPDSHLHKLMINYSIGPFS